MATRSSSRTAGRQTTQAIEGTRPTDPESMGDMARQQMVMTVDTIARNFRTAAALRQAQQQMMERAADLYGRAADELRSAGNPADVSMVLSRLPMALMQEALRNYQDLMVLGTRLAGESMEPTAAVAPGISEAPTATEAVTAAMDAAAPMWQAWQAYLTRTLDGMKH